LGKAFKILLSSVAEVSGAGTEMTRESVIKVGKMSLCPPEGAEGIANSFLNLFMVPVGWGL